MAQSPVHSNFDTCDCKRGSNLPEISQAVVPTEEIPVAASKKRRILTFTSLDPRIRVFLKAGLSLAVLGYLFRQVETKQLWESLMAASLPLFLLALTLELFNHTLSALRWKVVTDTLALQRAFGPFVRYYFIGMFFNLFLPSPLGGDVARGIHLAKGKGTGSAVAASVFLDRYAGMISLLTISLAASFFFFTRVTGVASGLLDLVLLLALLGALFLGLSFSFWPTFPGKIGSFSEGILQSFSLFWHHPKAVAEALGISFLCQSIAILVHILLGYAVGLEIPTAYYFVFVPVSTALGALPISLNGLGIREGSYFYFLGLLQVPGGQALGFSLLWFLILVCSGLIGGVLYLLGERRVETMKRSTSP